MNFSFSFLEKEINSFFKIAVTGQVQSPASGSSDSKVKLLNEIKERFDELDRKGLILSEDNIDNFEEKISSLVNEKKEKIGSFLPGVSISPEQIKNNIKTIYDRLSAISQAKKIADAAVQNLPQHLVDGKLRPESIIWIFGIFQSIRNLMLQDIEILGKKEVESYFPIYRSILPYLNLKFSSMAAKMLAEITKKCQEGILFCYQVDRSVKDAEDIINNIVIRGGELSLPPGQSNINLLMRYWDNQPPSNSTIGNLMLSGAIHTIKSGERFAEAKDIPKYVEGKITQKINKDKIFYLNEILKDIGVSFLDLADLEKKNIKIKIYTQLTGDDEISRSFSTLLKNINLTKFKDPDKAISNIKSYPAFQRIKDLDKKFKIILRLNFTEKTVKALQENMIVQSGGVAKLMKNPRRPESILLDLSSDELSKLANLTTTAMIQKNEHLLYALSQEIDNLLFKIN